MQTVYEDKAITIAANQDRYLLSNFQYALSDLSDGFRFERCAALYRHVDVCDRKFFSPHHGTPPMGTKKISLSLRIVSFQKKAIAAPLRYIRCHTGPRAEWQRAPPTLLAPKRADFEAPVDFDFVHSFQLRLDLVFKIPVCF
jgi:hypothetical protein